MLLSSRREQGNGRDLLQQYRSQHGNCAAITRSLLHDHVAALLTHRQETMLFHDSDYLLTGK
jgi:hypothetical protein